MKTFSTLGFLFFAVCLAVSLPACGKKGTPTPPDDCDFNSFPDTTLGGTPKTKCPAEKFPAVYPPE